MGFTLLRLQHGSGSGGVRRAALKNFKKENEGADFISALIFCYINSNYCVDFMETNTARAIMRDR